MKNTKGIPRQRIPARERLAARARFLLMRELMGDPRFAEGLQELQGSHPVVSKERSLNTILIASHYPAPYQHQRLDPQEAKDYLVGLTAIAEAFGLRSDWAGEEIHRLVVYSTLVGLQAWEPIRAIDTIHIDVPVYPTSTLRSVVKYVVEELQDKWPEITQKQKQAIVPRHHGRPDLETHVHWLYERLALKKPPRLICQEHDVGQDAVEKALRDLYRLLGITAPRDRGPSTRRR